MQKFVDDDHSYHAWLGANPEGYVVNSYREPRAGYLKLHKSDCWTVSRVFGRGTNLTRTYSKTCGTRPELTSWARALGGDLHPCPVCRA